MSPWARRSVAALVLVTPLWQFAAKPTLETFAMLRSGEVREQAERIIAGLSTENAQLKGEIADLKEGGRICPQTDLLGTWAARYWGGLTEEAAAALSDDSGAPNLCQRARMYEDILAALGSTHPDPCTFAVVAKVVTDESSGRARKGAVLRLSGVPDEGRQPMLRRCADASTQGLQAGAPAPVPQAGAK